VALVLLVVPAAFLVTARALSELLPQPPDAMRRLRHHPSGPWCFPAKSPTRLDLLQITPRPILH
jgi:hypothetical protein